MDVAASDDYMDEWIAIAQLDDECVQKHHVIALLSSMTQYDYLCERLILFGAVKSFTQALWSFKCNMKIYECCITALRRLVEHKDKIGRKIVRYGALESMQTFLLTVDGHYLPLVTATMELVQQISTNDYVCKKMIGIDFVPTLADTCDAFKGNFNVQKLCVTTMVRALTVLDQKQSAKHLQILLNHGIIQTMDYCVHTSIYIFCILLTPR